ncbi:uncharacterized protein N7496_004522 [Penicillium cataractarum]|uniref:Uncharacterized protein n=1 Tax=Penicillium cataractarum TaxID=2100454 RepID=A0A9W9SIW6_9EURO|nr:uncharacterized protein N7496_004522 [Penicillium cataractarum]KAJ5377113.1 hypothetical protein N7496_004522 [Penicillium cataractarum]
MPYFEYEYAATPNAQCMLQPSQATRQLTLSRCKYQYTRLIAPDYYAEKLTPEEALLKSTVEETLDNICAWVVDVGLTIDQEWFDNFDVQNTPQPGEPPSKFNERINYWKAGLQELMAWLGWVDQWTYCKDGCASDEVCFIPMWPMDSIETPGRYGPGSGPGPGYGYGPGYRYGPDRIHGRGGPPGKHPDSDGEGKMPSGKPSGGPPAMLLNEDSLWDPKCIKAESVT